MEEVTPMAQDFLRFLIGSALLPLDPPLPRSLEEGQCMTVLALASMF